MGQTTLRRIFQTDPAVRLVPSNQRRSDDFGAIQSPARDDATSDATLVEGSTFETLRITSTGTSEFEWFLDGAEKKWLVLYHQFHPLYVAHTSAALLRRVDREVLAPTTDTYLGALEAFGSQECAAIAEALPQVVVTAIGGESTALVDERIRKTISRRREDREVQLATTHPNGSWLLVDGGIGRIQEANTGLDTVAGIVKSHSKTYMASPERIQTLLDLKVGERTTAFLRERDALQGKEAYSFFMRLRSSEDQGPFFGLIRVELPPVESSLLRINEVAGWILSEASPLSLPDSRFDRLVYPIKMVEAHLKSRQPSDAALAGLIG